METIRLLMKMFEDNKCPMTYEVISKYNLSEKFIKSFCDKGCSVECGRFLKEELDRKGLLQVEGQLDFNDFPEVMPE